MENGDHSYSTTHANHGTKAIIDTNQYIFHGNCPEGRDVSSMDAKNAKKPTNFYNNTDIKLKSI